MSSKKSFVLYISNKEQFDIMTNEQAGELIKALFAFASGEEPTDFSDGMIKMAFSFISSQISRDLAKYEDICKRRSEYAKGSISKLKHKDESISEHKHKDASISKHKHTDNDNDNENEKDNDNENDNENDNDNEINYIGDTEETDKQFPAPHQKTDYKKIIEMYHSTCKSFPQVTALSKKRKESISARLRNYTLEQIQVVFEKAEQSSFLKGNNNRNWSASFDWIMTDSNFVKILDGNYDNKSKPHENGCNIKKYEKFINNF